MSRMAKAIPVFEMRAYGRRLRNARNAAGLTQTAVGRVIGCNQPFIAKVEAGEMLLRPIDYPPVADLLGVDVLELIGPLTESELAQIAADEELHRQRRRDWQESGGSER